jgi:hypothetical protein
MKNKKAISTTMTNHYREANRLFKGWCSSGGCAATLRFRPWLQLLATLDEKIPGAHLIP